jgi:integrase
VTSAKREPYLWQRGDRFHFRIAVPLDLRSKFKSHHIVEPLGTDSRTQARKLRDQKLDEWREKFQRARDNEPLSLAEIEAEARDTYYRMLEALEVSGERKGAKDFIEQIGMTAEESDIFSLQCVLGEALEEDDCQKAERAIKRIERDRGITLDRESKTYWLLARAVLRAQLDALNGRSNLLKGEPSQEPVNFLGAAGIDGRTLQPLILAEPAKAKTTTKGLRFSGAAEAYLKEQARDKDATIRQSTLKLHKKVFELFAAYSDDPPVDQVPRKVASGFLHNIGTERAISNRTLRQYSVCLAQVFKWAKQAGHSDSENPFTGQTFRAPHDAGWQPYEDDELKTLFSDSMFSRPIEAPLPWVMLIAIYSGLRLNEICQLKVADLHKEQGVWVIHVRGQLLKTPAAKRIVPLHSRLETAGLLEYARGLPGDGWLFPSLKPQGPDGKRSLRLTKKFTDYRRRKGIERKRLTFHSFRGNFASALDQAGVPQSDISALLGHSRGFSLNVYSSGGPGLQRLRELVEKVAFPSLQLNHLHTTA